MHVARRPLVILPCAALLALSLAACTSNPDAARDAAPPATDEATATSPPAEASTTPAAPPDMAASCDADAAQSFVGEEASEVAVAEAKDAAGAKGAVRVLKPGQPVTMDYNGDRLNVIVDDGNRIVQITCG